MFKQTIQGSVKLQRALWFTKLEGSRAFDTPAHIDGFWFPIPFTPRPTLHVKFNRKVQITPTGQPESWSRMLIAQSAEPTVMPMMVYVPKSLFSYAIPGPVHRVFEVHEPAGDVLRHAEETEHRAHLDLLRADLDDEELRQEVKELESKGGWLYDVAKANLRAVERELDEWFQ
ncbi:hypothetical protein CKM354_000466400 [Cercospora kikuchii]|uniref:Uncharacterized protein n=1 Tax=Cercospora kikuchii TaxID=84275 RepID=A0A9P3FBQ0_9PEZI|nr:uncharacterized protein CKM354_000466400 [Cercospora kikuchii]GIZ41358.1 hypothetical protein CKM354_000466400 [Cercospora kikuchii]